MVRHESERNAFASISPVRIFCAAPRDLIIAGSLAVFTQRSQTRDDVNIIGLDRNTEMVVFVAGHGF